MKADAIRKLRAEIAAAEETIESLELIPDQGDLPTGTMVRIRVTPRRYSGDDYKQRTHLLHKVSDTQGDPMWEFTGRLYGGPSVETANKVGRISWEALNSWAIYQVRVDSWELLAPVGSGALRTVDIEPCSHESYEERGGWRQCTDCGHGWAA